MMQSPREVVLAWVEAFNNRDAVAAADLYHEDAINLQVAAGAPKYVRVEDIPAETLEQEREKARNLALAEGKPENVIQRIVDGKMEKFYNDQCLLRQTYVRDENMTLEDLRNQHIAAIGENIVIRRFARWEVGEETQS